MIDLALLREPVEVYEAATGNREPLAQRIESCAEMQEWERAALAAYLRGELVPPKRGRGQRTLPHLADNTKEVLEQLRIENSVVTLRLCMERLGGHSGRYRNFKKVLEHVAAHDGLSSDEMERVVNIYRRAVKAKEYSDIAPAKRIVMLYQRWLLKTGRLPEFPQPVGVLESLDILKRQHEPEE